MSRTIAKPLILPPIAIRMNRRFVGVLCVVIIAIALPRWEVKREQGRVLESERYLYSVRCAQEGYRTQHGVYADDLTVLDLDRPEPTYFAVGKLKPGETGELTTSWSLTLKRFRGTAFCGDYQITFNERGLDVAQSTIPSAVKMVEIARPSFANIAIH